MTPVILTIWVVVMAATLIAAGTAAYKGYQAAGREIAAQMALEEKLAHKHYKGRTRTVEAKLEAGSFAVATSEATLLVKEGADGDTAEAEKADD